MEQLLYPRYDEMADRLVSRFPEVSLQQAESVRDLVRAVNPYYYDRRSKRRGASTADARATAGGERRTPNA